MGCFSGIFISVSINILKVFLCSDDWSCGTKILSVNKEYFIFFVLPLVDSINFTLSVDFVFALEIYRKILTS